MNLGTLLLALMTAAAGLAMSRTGTSSDPLTLLESVACLLNVDEPHESSVLLFNFLDLDEMTNRIDHPPDLRTIPVFD
jgi:hypothetical protein